MFVRLKMALATTMLMGAVLLNASPVSAETRQQDDCPGALVDLNCVKTELRVQAPAGHILAGEVLLPRGQHDVPVMMLISGTGRQAREFEAFKGAYHPHRDIARALLEAGIGVIRFDERSTGASTGDHRTARSADLRNDVKLIFDEASLVAGVERRRMYIFGHSEGAIFAMQLASENPLVAGIAVAGTPFKSGREMTWDQVQVETVRPKGLTDQQFSAYLQDTYSKQVNFVLSRPSLADLFNYDGKNVASNVNCPALVLEGLEDWQVRPPQGKQVTRAMRRAGNKRVTYIALADVGHLLTPNPSGVTDYKLLTDYSVDKRVTKALTGWVQSLAAR